MVELIDASDEKLRAQIRSLEYELSLLKQDGELAGLQHESDVRDLRTQAEADNRRAQAAEAAAASAATKLDALNQQIQQQQESAAREWAELETSRKRIQGQKQALQEEVDEAYDRISDLERDKTRSQTESDDRYNILTRSFAQIREEVEAKDAVLHQVQQKLTQRDRDHEAMEAQILKLKSTAADPSQADQMQVLESRVSEQILHIRKLESASKTQLADLEEFKRARKNMDVVEEEKRSLQVRLGLMTDLQNELNEVRLRNDALEDQQRSWTSYLEGLSEDNADLHFDSPEELARTFVHERMEKINLLNRLGELQPELEIKDEQIRSLQTDKNKLQSRPANGQARPGATGEPWADSNRAIARLERQKNLAVQETKFLRAQLSAFDAEAAEMEPERYNQAQVRRIQELESLVDSYRSETESLRLDMDRTDARSPISTATKSLSTGSKRPHEEAQDERVGELIRKNKHLQECLSKCQTRAAGIETDLKAKSSQLSAFKSSSRYRILELRNNPAATVARVKQSTIDALRAENVTLHKQLNSELPVLVQGANEADVLIPRASMTSLELTLQERDESIADRDKTLSRLRKIFRAKGAEFRELVSALLGWQVNFQQNGKVKISSIFYPNSAGPATDGEDEHFVEFDGEHGTMKVSGGPQSEFAREIRSQIDFWVDGKRQVPCFLAALTLEFYEKYGEKQELV